MVFLGGRIMDLIVEKVKEGKLIAALSLEDRVLANGVLPNSPPMERVSLVKGIVTGLLEQGRWNEAIRLVYQEGSPARVLFDGDWKGLRKEILASIKKSPREHYIGDNVAELLIKHNEAELLYDIACRLPLEEGEFAGILVMVEPKLPAERMKEGYNTLATRAHERTDFAQAYKYYQQAQNSKAIDNLYQQLFRGLYEPHLELLLTIAEKTNTTQNSRAAQTVYAVLEKPELLRFSRDISRRLMGIVREHKLALSTSQDDLLKDALVSGLALYELREIKHDDENLTLRWAKAHARVHPKDAYGVFKSRKYVGAEVNIAVQQGLVFKKEEYDHYQGLGPDQVEESHLRQVYDQLPLELQVSVAHHLKDNTLLQNLSRQYSIQNKAGSIESAYHLWIYGHGDRQDPYIEWLRAVMIKKELKDVHPSASLFMPEDIVGNRKWFTHMIERDSAVAYNVAQQIQDQSLVQQAREKMIRESPVGALRKFKGYREEDKDAVGINMALDALATQYGIPRERIDGYLALEK